MLKKLFTLFAALTLSAGLWADGSVFTYTATEKLESKFQSLGAIVTHDFKDGAGTVTYSGTITEIPYSGFATCTQLTSITIPAGVTTIKDLAFSGCSKLQSITIPAGVTTIGKNAFFNCSQLTSFTIPAGVTTIKEKTFSYCSKLQSITLPEGLATIEEKAFNGCTALASVTFLGNACQEGIATNAFSGVGEDAPALLTLPDSWTGSKPDEDGKWYGGKFELYEEPAPAPKVGDQFEDATSGLKFEITAVASTSRKESIKMACNESPANTVKVVANSYTGTVYNIPATVSYNDVTFAITEIGEKAFQNCSKLTSITIPEGVTTIGGYAFDRCSKLTSITLPASVTTIGEEAFFGCSALTSVTFLGNACQEGIGNGAFSNVGKIDPALLTLPANWTGTKPNAQGKWYGGYFTLAAPTKTSVITYTATEKLKETTSAGTGLYTKAFYAADSTQLTFTHTFDQGVGTITLDGEVAIVGKYAFSNTSMTAVTLPEGVTTIGTYSFYSCKSLQSITLPESVTTIGEHAFDGCTALASITIPASVTTIGEYAFAGCSKVQSVTIPKGVTTIGMSAFANCAAMTSISVDAANTHYGSVDGVLFNAVKDTLIQYPLGNTRTEYTIPASVKTIGKGAFMNCSALQSITIPAGVTTIGMTAFANCSALASVTFLGNACQDAIGANAFLNVGSTTPTTLVLPDNWTGKKPDEQGKWYGGKFTLAAPAKTSVITYTAEEKLPETTNAGSTEGLHLNAFYAADSTQLTVTHTFNEGVGTVTLDGEVAIIGDDAFYGSSITAITLPESVTTIGEYAFSDTGLESINFGEGSQLTTIGYRAFNGSPLKSISIPASVTTIGGNAFQSCSSLQSVTLPASLKSIRSYTFHKCAALTSITLPSSLDSIGELAFAKSGLASITIPASVDSIGGAAFVACTSLTSIVVEAGNTKYDSRDNCNGIVEKATNTLIAACKNTIIPNTVAILFIELFEALPITAITIPASVTTINNAAFLGCSSLAEVTVQWTTADAIPSDDNMGRSVFSGIADDAKLRVPTGTKALYEAAEVWQDFTIIEEYTPTALPTLFGDGVKGNKFMHKGQLIIRKGNKHFNALGAEVK